ncbi:MAG: hypothetical protein ACI8Z1_001200 [Candidatus Azotimanducaceae bacterium]|jgi:hypothetical protein
MYADVADPAVLERTLDHTAAQPPSLTIKPAAMLF